MLESEACLVIEVKEVVGRLAGVYRCVLHLVLHESKHLHVCLTEEHRNDFVEVFFALFHQAKLFQGRLLLDRNNLKLEVVIESCENFAVISFKFEVPAVLYCYKEITK